MKDILDQFDKAFENRVRLGIMSAVIANQKMDFNGLKKLLGVTDGNLASHIKSLEKSEYIQFSKEFLDRKPNTSYSPTAKGETAFKQHLAAIERLLRN